MVHNICHIICLRLLTENWALLYEILSMLATKKNACSQGKRTFFSTLKKKFLSTFQSLPFHTPLSNINDTEHLVSRNLYE